MSRSHRFLAATTALLFAAAISGCSSSEPPKPNVYVYPAQGQTPQQQNPTSPFGSPFSPFGTAPGAPPADATSPGWEWRGTAGFRVSFFSPPLPPHSSARAVTR